MTTNNESTPMAYGSTGQHTSEGDVVDAADAYAKAHGAWELARHGDLRVTSEMHEKRRAARIHFLDLLTQYGGAQGPVANAAVVLCSECKQPKSDPPHASYWESQGMYGHAFAPASSDAAPDTLSDLTHGPDVSKKAGNLDTSDAAPEQREPSDAVKTYQTMLDHEIETAREALYRWLGDSVDVDAFPLNSLIDKLGEKWSATEDARIDAVMKLEQGRPALSSGDREQAAEALERALALVPNITVLMQADADAVNEITAAAGRAILVLRNVPAFEARSFSAWGEGFADDELAKMQELLESEDPEAVLHDSAIATNCTRCRISALIGVVRRHQDEQAGAQ